MSSRDGRGPITILGAGILGSALADRLMSAGADAVRLRERHDGPPSATERSAGFLSYQGWDPWDLAVVRESAERFERLSTAEGFGSYRRTGGFRVARTPEDADWLRRAMEPLSTFGVTVELADRARAEAIAPALELEGFRSALYTPDDATFSAEEAAWGFRRRALRAGAELVVGDPVERLRRVPDGWELVSASGKEFARRVVVAAGPDSKRLLAGAGFPQPLAPFRAQRLLIRPRHLARDGVGIHDLDRSIYLRGAPRGRLLVGDGTGREEVDPTRAAPLADPEFVERSQRAVRELLPGLEGVTVEAAEAAVCVASPDRFPLVGPVPGASGLFVATGFNGLGAMRAPALASRLADGILRDRWEGLVPAAPSRFPSPPATFPPRPEFPMESPDPLPPAARVGGPAATVVPDVEPVLDYRPRPSNPAAGRAELSEWFGPWVDRFARDAAATGGEVEWAEIDGAVVGATILGRTEGIRSVFSPVRAVAERARSGAGRGGLYADRAWWTGGVSVEILAADLRDWRLPRPIRTPVRIADEGDLEALRSLMRPLAGDLDEAWFARLPRPDELAFVVELDDRLVGVSWASVAGRHARGHSYVVHPRYRGLGLGTDLLLARSEFLRSVGIEDVVSEIYAGNAASFAAAEAAGMTPVATMYHYPGGATGPAA